MVNRLHQYDSNDTSSALPAPTKNSAHYENIVARFLSQTATRRGFLLGAGAGLPLVGGLARAANAFSLRRYEHGAALAMSGLDLWRIDTRWFDGDPSLDVEQSHDALKIALREARFPGTDVAADLVLSATARDGEWYGDFSFPALRFKASVRLSLWLLGLEAATGQFAFSEAQLGGLADHSLADIQGVARFTPNWAFDLESLAHGRFKFHGSEALLDRVRWEIETQHETEPPVLRTWLGMRPKQQLAMPFHQTRLDLHCNGIRAFLESRAAGVTASIEAAPGNGEAAGVVCWRGQQDVRVPVRSALLRLASEAGQAQATASALLYQEAWVQVDQLAVRFVAQTQSPVIALAAAAPVQSESTTIELAAERFPIPIPGFDSATFVLRPGTLSDFIATPAMFAQGDVDLDWYDLVLRRASDALFCTVRFRGINLVRRFGRYHLVQNEPQPRVEFDFGSQHVLEEAVYLTDWNAGSANDIPMPAELAAIVLKDMHEKNQVPPRYGPLRSIFNLPNRAFADLLTALENQPLFIDFRGSTEAKNRRGPQTLKVPRFEPARATHLTFSLHTRGDKARLELSADALFAWTDLARRRDDAGWLEPVLPRRAAPPGTLGLPPREAEPGPEGDDLEISRPLSLAEGSAPWLEYATAIEAPARLVWSPLRTANGNTTVPWKSPGHGPADSQVRTKRFELWHARLSGVPLRAVYTPDAAGTKVVNKDDRIRAVDVFNPPAPYAADGVGVFRAALDARDRHELLALTGLFGYPATAGSTDVVSVNQAWRYRPVPVEADLLLLSSQGASFRYRGTWDPPAAPTGQGALSVKRYVHRAQLGRDIFCRVEYKGFVFPLGHPAILVKVTERRFRFVNKQARAELVQRFFIRIPEFTRAFPAEGQSGDARLWGHASISMDAWESADLDNPVKTPVDTLGPRAFWPVLAADKQDVQFTFYERDSGARYTAPQIWIDNSVANRPGELKKVVDLWRSGVVQVLKDTSWGDGPQRYFAQVLSGRLPYIAGNASANTNLETTRVLLGVQLGQESDYTDLPADLSVLTWTLPMKTQAQPPFYPVRRRARVRSSIVAGVTGQTASTHLLEFDHVFAVHGTDSKQNAVGVFGVFFGEGPKLSFAEDTSRAGGMVSPSSGIVWMSEQRGPIGGPRHQLATSAIRDGRVSGAGAPLVPMAGPSADTGGTVYNGGFNPREYFAQALGDARLLGVVKLADILDVVRQASGAQVPTLVRQEQFDLGVPALRLAVMTARQQLQNYASWFEQRVGTGLPPALVARLLPTWTSVRRALDDAQTIVDAREPDQAALLASAYAVATALKNMQASVRRAMAKPVLLLPDEVQNLVTGIVDTVRLLSPPDAVVQELARLARAQAVQKIEAGAAKLLTDIEKAPAYVTLRARLLALIDAIEELEAVIGNTARLVDYLRRRGLSQLKAICRDVRVELTRAGKAQACVIAQALGQFLDPYLVQTDVAALTTNINTFTSELHIGLDRVAAILRTDPTIAATRPLLEQALARARSEVASLAGVCDAHLRRVAAIGSDGQAFRQALASCAVPQPSDIPRTQAVVDRAFDELLLGARVIDAFSSIGQGLEEVLRLPAQCNNNCAQSQARIELGKLIGAACVRLESILFGQPPGAKLVAQLPKLQGVAQLTGVDTELLEQATRLHKALWDTATGLLKAKAQSWAIVPGAMVTAVAALQSQVAAVDAVRVNLGKSLALMAPERVAQEVFKRVQQACDDLVGAAQAVTQLIDDAERAAGTVLCSATSPARGLATSIPQLQAHPMFGVLSQELRSAISAVQADLQQCNNRPDLEQWVADFTQLGAALGRVLAIDRLDQLVDFTNVLDKAMAGFGIPTRMRFAYNWTTEVRSFPSGPSAIFEPHDTRRLEIKGAVDTELRTGNTTTSLSASLSPFSIHLFGKSGPANFLSITFNGMSLEAKPGGKLTCTTSLTEVRPGDALEFVKRLSVVFGTRSGFVAQPTAHGLRVGYQFASEYEVLGGLVLQNIALLVAVDLPFDNSPVVVTLRLSDRTRPCLVSAGLYGGGGFLSIETRADTLQLLEASFEFGGVTAYRYGPLSGKGRITAGIYIRMGGRNPLVEGFFCAEGAVSIGGLIHMSATLRVALAYDIRSGTTRGSATYTFKIKLGFTSYRYRVNVNYARKGDSPGKEPAREGLMPASAEVRLNAPGAAEFNPSPAQLPPTSLLRPLVWRRYWAAFTALPTSPDWISVCRPMSLEGKTKLPATVQQDAGDEQVVRRFEWRVVPWGLSKNEMGKTLLQASVSVLPILLKEARPFPKTSVRELARSDWPRFIATVDVALDSDAATTPQGIGLGQCYLAQLKKLGVSLAQASEIWQAIMDGAELPTELAQDETPAYTLHDSQAMADATRRAAGEQFLDALSDFEQTGLDTRLAGGFLAPAPPSDAAAAQLDELAGMLLPGGASSVPSPAPASTAYASAVDDVVADALAFLKPHGLKEWMDYALGAPDDGANAFMRAKQRAQSPYSQRARNFIDEVKQRIPASRAGARLVTAADSALWNALLLRRVAYACDAQQATDTADVNDFHARLAGLSSHPWLLKVLGLSIDIQADLGWNANITFVAVSGVYVDRMRTANAWTMFEPTKILRTKLRDGYAAARSSTATSGVVQLDGGSTKYTLTQVDIDRTPERLLQAAVKHRNARLAGARGAALAAPLQPQETVGLSLITLPENSAASTAPAVSGTIDIYEEDLLIGYRPDVQRLRPNIDPSGATQTGWCSLMARKVARVTLRGRDVTNWFGQLGVDEGVLVPGARTLPGNAADLNEGEVFRWSGWNLGAPHPDTDGAPDESGMSATAPIATAFEVEYASAPGMVEQRFGDGYRVGMRKVFVDGNSLPIAVAGDNAYREASGTVLGDGENDRLGFAPFLRYEHIAPPLVLLVDQLDKQRFPMENAHTLRVASRVPGSHQRRVTKRVLVPPRASSIDLLIRHGMFDSEEARIKPPPSAFPGIKLSKSGEFPAFSASEDRYFRRDNGAAAPANPYYPDPWAQRMIIGVYRADDDCLLGYDYFDFYDDDHVWPNCRQLELEVQAVDALPGQDDGVELVWNGARLTVNLTAASHVTVRIWHEIDVDKLNQSAIVDQVVAAVVAAGPTSAVRKNLAGSTDPAVARAVVVAHLSRWWTRRDWSQQTIRPSERASVLANLTSYWMLNPFVELDILHAVGMPAFASELAASQSNDDNTRVSQLPAVANRGGDIPFAINRKKGDTTANFSGHVFFDRPAISSLVANAAWTENPRQPFASGTGPAVPAQPIKTSAQLFVSRETAALAASDNGDAPSAPLPIRLGLAQQRQRLDAVLPPTVGRQVSLPVVPSYDFGDTRARVISIDLESIARHVAEFAGLPASAYIVRSKGQRAIVPGTERPRAPVVEYVIPLYSWTSGGQGREPNSRTRQAGWSRIWLGREWYSSGNGELLALVCWPPHLFDPTARKLFLSRLRETPDQYADIPAAIEPFVTRWGADPLAQQSGNLGHLPASAFANRLRSAAQMRSEAPAGDAMLAADLFHLQDMPTFEPVINLDSNAVKPNAAYRTVLALYRPILDTVTGRWYVDVQLAPRDTYCPFVRLALARYQPHALPELRLSEIVPTEFVRLLPERSLTVTPALKDQEGYLSFSVVLAGATLGSGGSGKPSTALTVSIERRTSSSEAWVPENLGKVGARDGSMATMAQDAKTGVWHTRVALKSKSGTTYSLVIEEYEQYEDTAGSKMARLVYFDRIGLTV